MNDKYCLYCGTKAGKKSQVCEVCGVPYDYANSMPNVNEYPQIPLPVYKVQKKTSSKALIAVVSVSIIVILAAVFYVMVIMGGGTAAQFVPAGSVQFTGTTSDSVKITFGTFSPVPACVDLKVILTPSSGANPVVSVVSVQLVVPTGDTTNIGANRYYDYQWSGNQINAGDYLTVNGLIPSTTYTITIFHGPSGSLCTLAGAASFTTSP
jgi:FlaG/FlaF family flagellin (archaellin)